MMLPYPRNGRWGYVDEPGRSQIKPVYKYAEKFSEGLAIVRDTNGKAGAIDKRGRVVIPCIYRELEPFWGGFAVGHRFGSSECEILRRTGISVTIEDSKWLDHLSEYYFSVCRSSIDGFTIVDHKGEMVNSATYQAVIDVASSFGFVHCKRENTYRIEDFKGRVLRAYDVDEMWRFCNGRAASCRCGKWGVIDVFGKTVLPMKFKSIQRIDDTVDRYVLVELFDKDEGLFHLYDMRTGVYSDWVVEAMTCASTGGGDFYWVLQNDMWSILNDKFETIMPNVGFSVVTIDGDNLVRVESENGFRYYVLDNNGYRQLF